MTTVRVERLPHAEGLPLPAYETGGSAGMDLRAAVAEDAPLTLAPASIAVAMTDLVESASPQFRSIMTIALAVGIVLLIRALRR